MSMSAGKTLQDTYVSSVGQPKKKAAAADEACSVEVSLNF
jgi:hypothetical protein